MLECGWMHRRGLQCCTGLAESICVRAIYDLVSPINWQFGGSDYFAVKCAGDSRIRRLCLAYNMRCANAELRILRFDFC